MGKQVLETRGEKKERSYTSWIKGVKDVENLGLVGGFQSWIGDRLKS